MTKEEKQFLLKDLCARLPYGVKVCARFNTGNRYTANVTAICGDRDYIQIWQNILHPYTSSSIEDIRPYFRPMSSMTEDERDEFRTVGGVMSHNVQNDTWAICAFTPEAYDWLNEHYFDYRGLIKKGLALEAPEGMYKTE